MIPPRFNVHVVVIGEADDDYPRSLLDLEPAAHIELRREPDNDLDRDAVAVLANGQVVGYLPRPVAAQVSRHMAEGGPARVVWWSVLTAAAWPDWPGLNIEVDTRAGIEVQR